MTNQTGIEMGSQSGWSRVFSLYDQSNWNGLWDPSQAEVGFSHCMTNQTGMEMGSQSGWSRVFSLYDQSDWNGDGIPVRLESSFLIV